MGKILKKVHRRSKQDDARMERAVDVVRAVVDANFEQVASTFHTSSSMALHRRYKASEKKPSTSRGKS